MYNIVKIVKYSLLIILLVSCKKEADLKTAVSTETVSYTFNPDEFDYHPTSTTNQIIFHTDYTLSYSEKHEQAEWVAYELKRNNLSNSNFKRPFFIEDPKVTTRSADWRNYKNSGYDRGHLVPAGDMKFSKEAFDATFYTSNVTPQLPDFNNGIWNRLEQKVRYWAQKYDGLYVITGSVLEDNLPTIGKEKVAVPNYFYKVLLNTSGEKPKMIAFLVPHQESNRPLYEFVVSVKELEQRTGIDFFYQLPDSIENELENSVDYKKWSFN
ncbi:DNA/RNA non-specific endonuclease [Flavobacterium orientale]|uniref:Endonuclease n=1 Tax=Flavobacterium orientale TaxID=1756020 RepID=A0A916XYN2_9FLAO|nr:DNA/RNA non-specific endonuclease [Flavobacterium orientale]GGD20106.1 endonuclease [Flavobacterium orientale]